MMKYEDLKVGTKVKCLSSDGWAGVFQVGEVYPVTLLWDIGVHINGQAVVHFFFEDFEVVGE